MSDLPVASVQLTPSAAQHAVGRWHWIALGLIILVGLVLRFLWLDTPALWGDEAATFARTCGTFRELLEGNRTDGFVPLHYELYWAMGKLWQLTPWRMRVVPAAAGVLMIPAMYFMARQLVKPSTALLVALFTACSAFLLNYSRDAKMYMELWLLMTLHVGCLLWWLRGAGGIAWWSWVASGVAMLGLQANAGLVIPIELVIFVTAAWRGCRWPWFLLRIALFLAGLGIVAAGPWYYYTHYNQWLAASGGIAPGAISTGSPNSSTFYSPMGSGIGWIEGLTRNKSGPELVRDSATAYLYGFSRAEELLIGGKVPIPPWVLNAAYGALVGIVIILLLGAVRWPGRQGDQVSLQPWGRWRMSLWLACWLILPAYGFFYCRSVHFPASPTDWLSGAAGYLGVHWFWVLPCVLIAGLTAASFRWVNCLLAWGLMALALFTIAFGVLTRGQEWYLQVMQIAQSPLSVALLLIIAGAITWANCGATTRQRAGVALVFLGVTLVVLLLCEGAWYEWHRLREAAEKAGRAWAWQSMWMPRYLAVVWPAVALTLAVAIMRLPTWSLRAAVIAAVTGVNLLQFGARLALDPEPRIDLVAKDIVRGDKDPNVRVFIRDRAPYGSPGTGTIHDSVGKYYLIQEVGGTWTPDQARMGPSEAIVRFTNFYNFAPVLTDLKRHPTAQRVILWDRQSSSRESVERVQQLLGANWKLVSSVDRKIRRHWNWQDLDSFRRMEFERTAAATQPVRAPATRKVAPKAVTGSATTQPATTQPIIPPW